MDLILIKQKHIEAFQFEWKKKLKEFALLIRDLTSQQKMRWKEMRSQRKRDVKWISPEFCTFCSFHKLNDKNSVSTLFFSLMKCSWLLKWLKSEWIALFFCWLFILCVINLMKTTSNNAKWWNSHPLLSWVSKNIMMDSENIKMRTWTKDDKLSLW